MSSLDPEPVDFYIYIDGKTSCQRCGDYPETSTEDHARIAHQGVVGDLQRVDEHLDEESSDDEA